MSNGLEESARIPEYRPAAATPHSAPRSAVAETERPAERPAYEISFSSEAKAALEAIRAKESDDRADRARQGAKEIAAAAGVSEAKAVDIAQPLRSPPPAKGVALFQANLSSGK